MIIPHWPIYTGLNKDFENTHNRMIYILDKLGNPHLKMKNIIHITGTKGKGSTALYISNILKSSGYKVNTYTSPHIYECNERILLNNEYIRDEEILELTEQIRYICEEGENQDNPIEPSLFETITCIAFSSFAKHQADFNVIEVGMGGKFDATNVFDYNQPVAVVFTPIHLDHTKFLGNKIEDIAWNKAFLIKKDTKNVVLSSQAKEAKMLLNNVVKELKIDENNFYCYGDDYEVFKNEETTEQNNALIYESNKLDTCFTYCQPTLQGDHQFINSSCAITTCLAIQKQGLCDNLTLDAINNGIKQTTNIVRMEKIDKGKLFEKLPQGSLFYIDGAHNQLASHALATFIQEFKAKEENKQYKIIIAIARTKGANNEVFLQELLDHTHKPIVDLIIPTRALESIPEPPETIANACNKLHFNNKIAYTINEVINNTIDFAKNNPVLLICTGSLYIARDVRMFS